MVTTSYKVMCLPLTKTKERWLLQQATEYAQVYNFASKFLPSLPEKYYETTNPSKLYNKWITIRKDDSQPLKSDILSGSQMLNAIKDACANFKTIKQLHESEFKKAKKHMHIETPNIIKFENSEYDIVKTESKKGEVHFGLAIGKKIKGKREMYLPLRTNTIEREERRKAKGKEWGLIEHLELGMKMKQAKKVRDRELKKKREKEKSGKRAKGQKAGLGVITYNLKDNTISIPLSITSPKFRKKDAIRTFIGINRGIRNSAALVAINIDEEQLRKLREYQEIVGIPTVSRYVFNNLNDIGGKVIGVKIINNSYINNKKQQLRKINEKRQKARKKVGHRIRNITDTIAHQISSEIVKFVSRFESPVVFFEDLTNIKQKKLRRKYGGKSSKSKRRMLSRWDYGNIKKKTLYKLEAIGIWTMDVNPMFVSQTCHICGSDEGVKDSTHFKCERCGLGTVHNKDTTSVHRAKNQTTDTERKNMDAISYKHITLDATSKDATTIHILKIKDATIKTKYVAHRNNSNKMDGVGSNPINIIGQYNANINSSINIALKGLHSLYRYKEEIPLYGYEVGFVADPCEQPDENVMKPIPTAMSGIEGIKTRRNETIADYPENSGVVETTPEVKTDGIRSTLRGSAQPMVSPPRAGGSERISCLTDVRSAIRTIYRKCN